MGIVSRVKSALSLVSIALLRNAFSLIPPAFSAAKIKGVRAYEKARKGEEVKLEPRQVFIKEFVLTKIEIPSIFFRIVCSKGTYIRSIARDFGNILGVGAYLTDLCRTRIGEFKLKDASTIDEINPTLQS